MGGRGGWEAGEGGRQGRVGGRGGWEAGEGGRQGRIGGRGGEWDDRKVAYNVTFTSAC